MNKSRIINIAVMVIGFSLGFLAGKKTYEKYYADLAQEEIDSVKERFSLRGEPKIATEDDNDMTDEEYTDPKPEKLVRTNTNSLTRSSLEDNPYEKAKRNYNLVGLKGGAAAKPDEDEEEEESDEPLTDAAGKTEKEMAGEITANRTQPYLIDDEEFINEFDHHEKISLYYYSVDDILADEDEKIVDDIEGTIGYDAISAFDKQTTIWVRNEPLSTDYEVICINKSFAEAISGENMGSPRERYARQNRRETSEE